MVKKIKGLKFITIFSLLVIFSSCNKASSVPLPDYKNWTRCFGHTIKTCFDNNPYLAMNGITEYSYKDTDVKALLIWWQYERSTDTFNMHGDIKSYQVESVAYRFYKRAGNDWVLVETRNFARGTTPKNQKIPLFERTSPFGREYMKFKSQSADEEIIVPEMTFVE